VNFSLLHYAQTGSGALPASYPVGSGGLSPGIKQLGCEADHSAPVSAKVKECMAFYLRPQYVFMAWCLVKHRDNFYGNKNCLLEVVMNCVKIYHSIYMLILLMCIRYT
jgi:hypothetical protein